VHAEYFLVLGAILFFPLVLSVLLRLRMYTRYRSLLKSMVIVCGVFWIWDVLATARGHWSFNPSYVMGWDLLGMPAEEWLFFPVLVFVSVFTYEAVRKVWKGL
jgi:lycopene beta-cyclase